MEASTQEEFRKSNHAYLQGFLIRTEHLEDELAESMKAVISQFIHCVRVQVDRVAYENMICEPDIYELQINSLRQCIIDLDECLNRCLKGVTAQ